MTWETITLILGAVGGLDLIKWVWTRRASKRVATTEAERAEWELIKEQLLYYQEEAKDKTKHIRELVDELIEVKTELATKRCNRQGCPNRQPPNGY